MRYFIGFYPCLAACIAIVAGSIGTAQNTLTTTFDNDACGPAGGAIYFDLIASSNVVLVNYVDLNLGVQDPNSNSIKVYRSLNTSVGRELDPNAWTLWDTPTKVPSPNPWLTRFEFAVPLFIGSQSGDGFALVTDGDAHAYTVANGSAPLAYTSGPLTLTANSASDRFVLSANTANSPSDRSERNLIQPCVPNLTLGFEPRTVAGAIPVRHACGQFDSFHQRMDPLRLDLVNKAMIAVKNGPDYTISISDSPGFVRGPGATPLSIGNDDQAQVGSLGLTVGSNCWVAFGPGNSTSPVPTEMQLRNNPSTAIYSWTDLDPTAPGGGRIYYEEAGQTATVTYDGVFGHGTSGPNTVQFQVNTGTGDFRIDWGSVSPTNPQDWLVGFSPGGESPWPNPLDISTLTSPPYLVVGTEIERLRLRKLNLPHTELEPKPVSGDALRDSSGGRTGVPSRFPRSVAGWWSIGSPLLARLRERPGS